MSCNFEAEAFRFRRREGDGEVCFGKFGNFGNFEAVKWKMVGKACLFSPVQFGACGGRMAVIFFTLRGGLLEQYPL